MRKKLAECKYGGIKGKGQATNTGNDHSLFWKLKESCMGMLFSGFLISRNSGKDRSYSPKTLHFRISLLQFVMCANLTLKVY